MGKRIVITGFSAICAIGSTPDEIAQSLQAGTSGVTKQRIDGIGELYVGVVNPAPSGCDSSDSFLDPTTRFALECAPLAIKNSQLSLRHISPDRIGVIISSSKNGVKSFLVAHEEFIRNKQTAQLGKYLTSYLGIDVSDKVAQSFGITGPTLNYPTACATGLVSVAMGCNLIKDGFVDVALAGSSEASIHPLIVSGFDKAGVLSKGISKPFSKNRDGFNIGEGCAVFVLEDLEHARKRNAPIIAEVCGYSFGNDAYHITNVEPSGETIAYSIRHALEKAEIGPRSIEYINAHGTGTKQNDLIETSAIKQVFAEYAYEVPVSSLKPYFGHLLGASGSVELAASIAAMNDGFIPPTLFLDEPDEKCDLFYVPLNPIEAEFSTMMKLSYGFGGHIAVMIVKKWESGNR